MNTEEAWNYLEDSGLASDETLKVVTCISGYSLGTLEDILYAVTGYRTFEQYMEATE
jgi:hypothetical protein